MDNKLGLCKECNEPLKKIKCPKDSSWYEMWFDLLLWFKDIFLALMALLWSNTVDDLEKKVITCCNKKCSSYLKECNA